MNDKQIAAELKQAKMLLNRRLKDREEAFKALERLHQSLRMELSRPVVTLQLVEQVKEATDDTLYLLKEINTVIYNLELSIAGAEYRMKQPNLERNVIPFDPNRSEEEGS